MPVMISRYLLSTLAAAAGVAALAFVRDARSPTVQLGYATYEGTRLAAGVDQYLGMRYAQPPVGDLRLRAPRDPVKASSVQSANSFGPICLGVNQNATDSRGEDCLFVNVFTPSNATSSSKLPVWVYIQGGGYAANSNANYNGTGVVRQSGHNIVFVNFNYRVGALGFLASEKIRADGDLNAGLLDQRKLLEWVQKHIAQFGGDPAHVVIHGASAGGGSVAYHLTAYNGRDDKLFVGASPESPFWPTQRTVAQMEFQFDRFLAATNCSAAGAPLACLRALPIAAFQAANVLSSFPGAPPAPNPRWSFLPVVDGTLVADHMYALFAAGRFVRVPQLVGDDTDEGTFFAPNASSAAEASAFLRANYPRLSDEQVARVAEAYPPGPEPQHAAFFASAAGAYGDATFTCPGTEMARAAAAAGEAVWNYRYNVLDADNVASGLGVPHTFETTAIFGVGNAGGAAASYSGANAAIVPVTMEYWISFVRALDPNPFRAEGAPVWEKWGDGEGKRLRLQTNDTAMENVPSTLWKKCALWKELAPTMDL